MAIIGKSIVCKGELAGEEDLEIEGRVEGRVTLPSHQLTIGEHGRAHAEIAARDVIITGHVVGNVTAAERCEIRATGILEGDVRTPRLVIHEGAVVNGNVETGDKGGEPV